MKRFFIWVLIYLVFLLTYLAFASLLQGCSPPRLCHLQQVEVKYFPAHPCRKLKNENGSLVQYEGFCPERCSQRTTCILWCSEIDAQGKGEAHPPHPTVVQNLGSSSVRCNDQGQLLF